MSIFTVDSIISSINDVLKSLISFNRIPLSSNGLGNINQAIFIGFQIRRNLLAVAFYMSAVVYQPMSSLFSSTS